MIEFAVFQPTRLLYNNIIDIIIDVDLVILAGAGTAAAPRLIVTSVVALRAFKFPLSWTSSSLAAYELILIVFVRRFPANSSSSCV